jgi:hypothetical protein
MLEDFYPVQWVGGQAVVSLPEHIGASNAGQVRDAGVPRARRDLKGRGLGTTLRD